MTPKWIVSADEAVVTFKIQIAKDYIFLRGSPQDASPVMLRGTLVLCLAEPVMFSKIQVRLKGRSFTEISRQGELTYVYGMNNSEFFRIEKTLVRAPKLRFETLTAGNHEYPFQFFIPGDTPESVEGVEKSYVVYVLKASVGRVVPLPNLVARQHLRVVRTLDTPGPDLPMPVFAEKIKRNVKYCFSLPRKTFIFGTFIPTTLKVVPLCKGLSLHSVELTLFETIWKKAHRVTHPNIEEKVTSVSVDIEREVQNLEEEAEEIEEGWLVRKIIPLPTSLNQCRQDVNITDIHITHFIQCRAQFANLEGEPLEIKPKVPVVIFLSPSLPVGENNELIDPPPPVPQGFQELDDGVPPPYGEHRYDRPWADIDPSGYITPPGAPPSGVNTPTRQRSASMENLPSHASRSAGSLSALDLRTLQTRLGDISEQRSREGSPSGAENRAPSRLRTGAAGEDGIGARTSRPDVEAGQSQPSRTFSEPVRTEYDVEALSQVPSYGAAMRSPADTPLRPDLPSYETATSSSPSSPTSPTQSSPGSGQTRTPGRTPPRPLSAILGPLRRFRKRSGSSQGGEGPNDNENDNQPLL